MSIKVEALKVMGLAACLTFSAHSAAFSLGSPVIAKGDMIKHFYQRYSGDIEAMEIAKKGGRSVYEMNVEEKPGVSWAYTYDAMTGRLLSKRSIMTDQPSLDDSMPRFAYEGGLE